MRAKSHVVIIASVGSDHVSDGAAARAGRSGSAAAVCAAEMALMGVVCLSRAYFSCHKRRDLMTNPSLRFGLRTSEVVDTRQAAVPAGW